MVEMFRPVDRPATENGPREMVQPMSALPSRSASGFSFLPFNSRGAWASIASRMASVAIATGATITEVRVTGGNGAIAVSAGRFSSRRCGRKEAVERPQRAGEERGDDNGAEQDAANRQAERQASGPHGQVRLRSARHLMPLARRAVSRP